MLTFRPTAFAMIGAITLSMVSLSPTVCHAQPPRSDLRLTCDESVFAESPKIEGAPASGAQVSLAHALYCLESKVSALDAQRRTYFKTPRRLAIAGGVTALALGLTTVVLYFRSDPFDEYAESSGREQRTITVVGSLSIASAVAAFVGLGWRIVAGARGTPVDDEFRTAKRQRNRLRRELYLQSGRSAYAVGFRIVF